MGETKEEVNKEVPKENKEPKEPKEPKNRYEQCEVVTQTGLAVKDNKTEKIFEDNELLVEILNKIDKIEKAM